MPKKELPTKQPYAKLIGYGDDADADAVYKIVQRPIVYKQEEEVVDKVFEFGRNNVIAAFGSNLATQSFGEDD